MFTNVSSKIKLFATVWCSVGFFGCIIEILVFMALSDSGDFLLVELPLILKIIIVLITALPFYISSLFLYGFGELIENTKNNFLP